MQIKKLWWLSLSVIVVLVDQWSKWLIVKHFPLNTAVILTPFFNVVHARNYGAAFSFLDIAGGSQRWLFVLISLIVCIAVIIWLLRAANNIWLNMGLSLILGGAMGNFWDRLTQGYVVDFLDFHWGIYHWPAFNVADSAVCVGAVLIFFSSLSRRSA